MLLTASDTLTGRRVSVDFGLVWKLLTHEAGKANRWVFAGTTTPLFSLTATRVAGFSVYQKAKYIINATIEKSTGKVPLDLVNTPGVYPDMAVITCFAGAGAVSGAVLTPIVGTLAE
jgi:hypothetical protein